MVSGIKALQLRKFAHANFTRGADEMRQDGVLGGRSCWALPLLFKARIKWVAVHLAEKPLSYWMVAIPGHHPFGGWS